MVDYPAYGNAAREIIKVGKQLEQHEYVVANDGNLSVRVGPDEVLATPTGVSKGDMAEEMLSVLNLSGEIIRPGTIPVSSEIKMHLRIYLENPELRAVVHAHPVTATSFAAAGIPLDEPILTEAVTAVGSIPVAHFATPGTEQVPESVAPFATRYNGALLANHGAISWASTLQLAWFRMQWIECYAKATLITKYILGRYNRLSGEQIQPIGEIRERLGITLGGDPMYASVAGNSKDVLPRSGEQSSGELIPIIETIAREVTQKVLTALGKDELDP